MIEKQAKKKSKINNLEVPFIFYCTPTFWLVAPSVWPFNPLDLFVFNPQVLQQFFNIRGDFVYTVQPRV